MSLPRVRTDTGPDNQEWLDSIAHAREEYLMRILSNEGKMDSAVLQTAVKRINGSFVQMVTDLEKLGKL